MNSIGNNQYNFELDYNLNNFYSATNQNDLPKGWGCSILADSAKAGLDCTNDANLDKCYQHMLCINRDLVKNLYDKRNSHSTADEGYMNMVNKYNFAVLKTINLSVGIIASLVFIYYHK